MKARIIYSADKLISFEYFEDKRGFLVEIVDKEDSISVLVNEDEARQLIDYLTFQLNHIKQWTPAI